MTDMEREAAETYDREHPDPSLWERMDEAGLEPAEIAQVLAARGIRWGRR